MSFNPRVKVLLLGHWSEKWTSAWQKTWQDWLLWAEGQGEKLQNA